MKKYLVFELLIVISIIIIVLLIVNKDNSVSDEFTDYIRINNYNDLKKYNPNYIQIGDKDFNNDVEEEEFITNFSLSLIPGLSYFSNPFSDKVEVINELDDDSIMLLNYMLMTEGKFSSCIKESFFLEQLYKYFKINIDNVSDSDTKKYNYDAEGKYFCFNSIEESHSTFEVDNYEKNNNIIKVTLKEDLEEEGIYKWYIEFIIDDSSYYIRSFQDMLEELKE